MYWPNRAVSLLAAAVILEGALATLVTVTEYASVCPNTRHHQSRSTKVVHSTVTVSPAPFTDHDANHGTPFFLEVQAFTGNTRQRRAVAPQYVMSEGFTTDKTDKAAQWVIQNEMLTTVSGGGYVSAHLGTQHQPFAISSTLKTENANWEVRDGILTWQNDYFDNYMARFFEIMPSGHKRQGEVLIRMTGPIFSTWTPIVLAAMPATNATQSSSAAASTSGHAKHHHHSHATGSGMASGMASSTPASSLASSKTHKKHHHHSASGQPTSMSMHTGHRHHHHSSATGKYTNMSSAASSPASTSSSMPVTPSGRCGTLYGGYSCSNSEHGTCCSQYGYCGSGFFYCGRGCQSAFGTCWRNGTIGSTNMTSSMTSMSMASSSSSTVSISTPSSTLTSLSGPIGPDHPLSINVTSSGTMSVTSTLVNGSSTSTSGSSTSTGVSSFLGPSSTSESSMTSSMSSTTTSPSPVAPPCPETSAQLCDTSSNNGPTTCSSSNGTPYNTTCGVEYQGTVINTTGISGLPSGQKVKRAMELTLGDCQTLCNYYTACVAINYIGTNCTLLSHVTGETHTEGAVAAAVPPQDVAAKTNPVTTTTFASTVVSSGSTVVASNASQTISMPNSEVSSPTWTSLLSTTTNRVPISFTSTSQSQTSSGSSSSSSVSLATSILSSPQQTSLTSSISHTSSSSQIMSPSTSNASSGMTSSTSSATSAISSSTSSATSATSSVISSNTMTSSTSTVTSSPILLSTSSSTSTTSTSINTGYLVLTSPTPCSFGDPPGSNEDDSFCEVTLPFAMEMYSQSSMNSYASTNGLLSIQYGTSQYSNQPFPASNIPNNTVAPFWDDLYLRGNSTPQDGIFYQLNTAQTAITYEYYLNRGNLAGTSPVSNATYHFTVAYDSTQPGIFTITYYATGGPSDNGVYAAVGMQGVSESGEVGTTYSFQSASITPGLVLKCTTATNSCLKVTT